MSMATAVRPRSRVRANLRGELRDLQRRLQIPTLMVTHDQEEAMALADTIVCMNGGRIEQRGTPQDLYLRPRTRFVADFMGHGNLLPLQWVRETAPELLAHARPDARDTDEACVRPERVTLVCEGDGGMPGFGSTVPATCRPKWRAKFGHDG